MELKDFADLPLDPMQRIERGHGLLENHSDPSAANLAQTRLRAGQKVLAIEQHFAFDDCRTPEQAKDGKGSDRLPRTRFADKPKGASSFQGERDAINSWHHRDALMEADVKTANVKERGVSHE
jgi:hypothetical protein